MAITIAQVTDAVETTVAAATGIEVSESFDELSEGVKRADTPLLMVYPEEGGQDPGSGTDRTAMAGGVRQTRLVIHVDVFAKPRSKLSEDMAALVPVVSAISDELEKQDTKPYFALAGIQAFSWTWTRAIIDFGGDRFMGARFVIELRIF